jgi:hypothetical protein
MQVSASSEPLAGWRHAGTVHTKPQPSTAIIICVGSLTYKVARLFDFDGNNLNCSTLENY